ncbi:general secretion pathway protein GspB [Luteimonas sp. MC1895]|uniref:general secretion pathway protein GspB n=1 Tax=Luteimonas sp. MC1895 TaxID=2819513 RepID=UPI0018F0A845|nr:general secretion pathway protein GspB [Luteimonas sp. MC1895]MBJ6980029.1 general secretion pathway protein GspB [Luteimonas sp. MC1895]
MSLILEALRKSEAERRRGDAPDLRVELPPPAPAKRRIPPKVWFACAAVLAALAVVVLWPGSDVRDAGAAQDADPAAASVATAPASEGWLPSAPEDATAPRSVAATAPRSIASDRSVPSDAGFPRVERIQAPDAAPALEPAPDLPLAPPPMAVRAAEEAAAARNGTGAETATATRETTATRDTTATLDPRRPSTPAADGTDDALRITGLSSGQRERLPALKLSLHMWNDDPARRFAVIDGQRRIEGDRLGDATITAIDRDGVLLDLDGQAVRVPLP